jgi:hypothetical protein
VSSLIFSFSMRSVSYQRNVDDYFFPELLFYLKHFEHWNLPPSSGPEIGIS